MDELQITILAAGFLIVAFVLSTSKNGRRFRLAHGGKGLYRASGVIRLAALVALLMFCATALITLRGLLPVAAGIAVIAASFIVWIPLQLWAHSYVFIDASGVTYFRPSGKSASVSWKDVTSVSYSRFGIALNASGNGIYIPAVFKEFDDIKKTAAARCPAPADR